ncbi:Ferrous iron transport protein B [Porphyromonas macacae]|uniref:Ferrous iron transport protein B n=1 Tax=Porphyromonas macacae TaxID=28115 RepID=A0A379EBA1_9PORP|nr:ferrous iron transport protein B [Porphyromonas macacae]SUB89720.1 Ferrous iron transport protein B [Porphyromonas macacae]
MKLSELKTGEVAIIDKVGGKGAFRKRILEMGFIQGKEVTVVHSAPLSDPIYYRILDYNVSLRRDDAALIEVRRIDVKEENLEEEPAGFKNTTMPEDSRPFLQSDFQKKETIRVALMGNPNCGKTSLFNKASGAHEHVGNYSGVTIEAKSGYIYFRGYRIELIDLPGTYSLSPYSPEERYIRNFLTSETSRPDIVLNVIDVTNIERNLYLTLQIKEMDIPMVVALNMFDEFNKRKEFLDYPSLGRLLSIPMVPTICRSGMGLHALFDQIVTVYEGLKHTPQDMLNPETGIVRSIHINYGSTIEPVIQNLQEKVEKYIDLPPHVSSRYIAVKLVEQDRYTEDFLKNNFAKGAFLITVRDYELKVLEGHLGNDDVEAQMTDQRYGFIAGALRETYVHKRKHVENLTDRIDRIVTHRAWGFPIFMFFMFIMFQCTFVLGEYPMQWLELLVEVLSGFVAQWMPAGPLKDLIINGVIGGVGGVIVFLPNILILYLFISIMEDTGYMSRAAFIMDRIMHKMGLHGKSFIPLVMGFGCNVPAIMATRTIESPKSRMITMLVLPFMSCSARLPVYLLLAGAFFPSSAGVVLFSLYLLGMLLAVITARILKGSVFKGEDIPFVMELPPYRIPTTKSVLIHMWTRGKQYLRKMGTVILLASIVIWFLGYFPRSDERMDNLEKQIARTEADASLEQAQKEQIIDSLSLVEHMIHQENSYIGRLGKMVEPMMQPLGFDWKMSVSLVSGLAAKEVVVSTLGVIYTGNADDNEKATAQLSERLKSDVKIDGTPSFSPLVAYSFMVFVLIYFPCIATVVAIGRESGSWKWSLFSILYSCTLAWMVSCLIFQLGSLL